MYPQHTREVMSPQRTDLVLAADVPDVEFGVLVSDRLDVEADGGDCCDVLVKLELVEDCYTHGLAAIGRSTDCREGACPLLGRGVRTGLSCSVQAEHQQPHLL